MQIKFRRNYSLTVETNFSNQIVINPPFTVEFDVTTAFLSSRSNMTIRVMQLGATRRDAIRKDFYDWQDIRNVTFQAGYGPKSLSQIQGLANPTLPTLFTGQITQAWSVRDGTTWVTTIEAHVGVLASTDDDFNDSFIEGTPIRKVIIEVGKTLSGIAMGGVGNYPNVLTRGHTLSGSAIEIIQKYSGNGFYINKGKFYVLGDNECSTGGGLTVLTSDSGLLGTPVRELSQMTVPMIFEPRLELNQKILLNSSTDQNFNGQHKIVSVHHGGMISESVCGDAVTTVGLWRGTSELVEVPDEI